MDSWILNLYIELYFKTILLFKFLQLWPQLALSIASVLLWYCDYCVCVCTFAHVCLSSSLHYGINSFSRNILYYLNSGIISHFFKQSWFLLWEKSIKNQNLGTEHVCCLWSVVASRPLQLTLQGNICVHTSLYVYAAATAKLLQSCPTLCNPIDGSPPGSPVPGILQARTLEWVAISFSNAWKWKVKVKSLSCVRLLVTPWTAAHQVPPSMGFSRQESWSGVPLPSLLYVYTHLLCIHIYIYFFTVCILS